MDYHGQPLAERSVIVGPPDPAFELAGRSTWTEDDSGQRTQRPLGESLLVGSEVRPGIHYPVIDIDVPMRLIPSTTPGHHHLYIDMGIPWDIYVELLKALQKVGIVEPAYVELNVPRGQTFVRLPWVRKVTPGEEPPRGGTALRGAERAAVLREAADAVNLEKHYPNPGDTVDRSNAESAVEAWLRARANTVERADF